MYSSNMSMTAEKIVSEALALSPQARAFVAEQLIESLDASTDTEISASWREEIRKRCREVDEGTVELGAAADVFTKAYSALA
jgi:putative addiction module component (TIGR02574 family)